MRVHSLGIHADYGCRSTGACCSSGWEIPVTPRAEERIRRSLETGRLAVEGRGVPLLRSRRGLPDGARVVFGLDVHGRCAFFEPAARTCAIHRQAGVEALPPSCRQFPRVALLTPVGTFLTLSHFCPTAAGLLFREDAPQAIVADPPAFPATTPWEGLDAREAWPPLLRPGVLLGWDGFELWQERTVSGLLRGDRTPEAAVAALRARTREATHWTSERGPLLEWLRLPLASVAGDSLRADFAASAAAWNALAARVPDRLRAAPPPLGPGPPPEAAWEDAHERHVAPGWPTFATPIRRYLAAKAFASWASVQGDGLSSWTRAVEVALGVLRVETTRQCLDAPLDAPRLEQAIRRADLLLLHLSG